MSPKDETTDEDMRQRALSLFSQDWPVLLHLLNSFFWRGMLATDAQVHCHNAAESYVMFLMGPPFPPKNLDPRYLEQLETLWGDVRPVDQKMSGDSYSGRDKPRRRKVKDV
jgi:hypothetical protein